MAIDSISNVNSANAASRAQTASQTSGLRNNQAVLNAIVQTQQRNSAATAPVKVFAVPQTAKTNSSTVKLPRGSLVDVVA